MDADRLTTPAPPPYAEEEPTTDEPGTRAPYETYAPDAQRPPYDRPRDPAADQDADAGPDGDDALNLPDATAAGSADVAGDTALLDDRQLGDFRGRWQVLQAEFVDDPVRAAAAARDLLGEVAGAWNNAVTRRRERLSDRHERGGQDTEALRLALRDYRALAVRLLDA